MADLDRARRDPVAVLHAALEDTRAGFLEVVGSGQHPQPMAQTLDPETGELWFITSRTTDLVGAVGQGATGRFIVVNDRQDIHASLVGVLEQVEQSVRPDKLDELWSVVAAAWFEEGRDDSDVTMLRFVPREAALWASTRNPVVFGLEVMRANVGRDTADLGYHTVIDLAA